MQSPLEKGNELEIAVHAIETAILNSSPSLREKTFTIENKKRVTVDGVRHEIDVYVDVDIGKGYKSVFIFECKNWEAAVGKNEIIIFSEKITSLQAQTGFFVAKSFTSDAKAQAAKDGRIKLLFATELNASETPVPFKFHILELDRRKRIVKFDALQRGARECPEMVPINIEDAHAVLYGADIDFNMYIWEWVDEVCDESNKTFPSADLDEGVYERDVEATRLFNKREFILNDKDIASIKLWVKYFLRVIRPPVVTHFDIASRGRAISLAPVKVGEGTVQAGFTALHQEPSLKDDS